MKKLIVMAFLAAVTGVSAQSVTKSLGDFSKVRVFDKINVKLVKAKENKIVITGTNASEVEVVTKNSDLKVKMKFSKQLKGDDITATLYYKFIDEIEASEGAYVVSDEMFKLTSIVLNAKEGAKIKTAVDVQKIKCKANTGGEIEVSGKASSQDITITSGGIVKAKSLVTSQTEVSVNGGGKADVNATNLVEATVNAGGNIDIFGNPKQVNKKTRLGGNIDIRN
jgi:hypothetical protein